MRMDASVLGSARRRRLSVTVPVCTAPTAITRVRERAAALMVSRAICLVNFMETSVFNV